MATPQSPLPATALGHAQLTVGATAVSLPDPPARTKRTLIRIVDEPVNWTDVDGEAPTSTTGMPLLPSESLVFDGDPNHFKLIRAAEAINDADVRIAYYG